MAMALTGRMVKTRRGEDTSVSEKVCECVCVRAPHRPLGPALCPKFYLHVVLARCPSLPLTGPACSLQNTPSEAIRCVPQLQPCAPWVQGSPILVRCIARLMGNSISVQ